MPPAIQALLSALDQKLPEASGSWRSAALRQIVDLFAGGAETYSGEQIVLFDDVMFRLMQSVDRATLAETGKRLAPIENAPVNAIGYLARHADAAVCGPVLEQAKALRDADLAAIAGNEHLDSKLLMKIARRPHLSSAVNDVLIKRGDKEIQRAIIANPDARVSESGFARIVSNIGGDKEFATAIAARGDVPAELRLWLARVLEEAPPSSAPL
jgi:uncharacterized protein (DUF2336 family)